jgi:hypothetical protein
VHRRRADDGDDCAGSGAEAARLADIGTVSLR